MIRIASYNVLADAYLRPDHYPFTPAAVLEPARRRKALVERIAALEADVVCLQEVEPAMFEALAARLGGEGRLLRKTGEKPDGCAVFVKGRRAAWSELVYPDGTGHVALAAEVEGLGIATTHLRWDAKGRLAEAQFATLLDAWVRPGKEWIVCGDLNVGPESRAFALALGRGLRDAYAGMPDAFTCNANRRARRIDFLFHTPGLRAEPVPIPPIDGSTPLPSEREPSDHLPIAASFACLPGHCPAPTPAL